MLPDRSCSYGHCVFGIWVLVLLVLLMNFVRGLRLCGGLFVYSGCLFVWVVVCLFGGLFGWGVLGGHAKLFFEKLHAQFAYYKSPELGLNLSGS